jgi:hypothetical protein
MPQGVEHGSSTLSPTISRHVRIPLMPQGVEHIYLHHSDNATGPATTPETVAHRRGKQGDDPQMR